VTPATTGGFPASFNLFLASASPRRRDLLDAVGIPYLQVEPGYEDDVVEGEVTEIAVARAVAKVEGALVAEGAPEDYFVLSADTVVAVGGKVLVKPANREQAAEMLGLLSGHTHEVVSGVALSRTVGDTVVLKTGVAKTSVRFRHLTEGDIEGYMASMEWEGKAGGYAIQGIGALLVEAIHGEYANVVGLPLQVVLDLFRFHGLDAIGRVWLSQ